MQRRKDKDLEKRVEIQRILLITDPDFQKAQSEKRKDMKQQARRGKKCETVKEKYTLEIHGHEFKVKAISLVE